ncbi:MAG: hypothetical protein ACE5KJ_02000 [Candidatus Zixiibacteriota bacterium]
MILTIFSAFGNWATHNTLHALGGILLLLLGWGVKKYLIPYLNTELRKKMAEYVLLIADEVTDELTAKYPKNELLKWLDQAVDKIMQITGVSEEVAARAAQAALARKGIK